MAEIIITWTRAGHVYGSKELTAGGVSVQSEAAPDFGGVRGFAEINVVAGMVAVAVGANPVASLDDGVVVRAGGPGRFAVLEGEKIAVLEVDAGAGGGDASAANQDEQSGLLGAVDEAAPATDIAPSGINGRLQRIAQRLTSLITALGSPFQALAGFVAGTFMTPYGRPYEIKGTFTPDTSAYAAADCMGPALALAVLELDIYAKVGSDMANAWVSLWGVTGLLMAAAAPSAATSVAPVIFDENPASSTITDNGPLTLHATDHPNVLPWVSTSASGGSNVMANALSWWNQFNGKQGLMAQCDANGKLYLVFTISNALNAMTTPKFLWRVQFGANV